MKHKRCLVTAGARRSRESRRERHGPRHDRRASSRCRRGRSSRTRRARPSSTSRFSARTPKLPPLGACRICFVEVGTPSWPGPQADPRRGRAGEIAWMPKVHTGCTTPVTDGMPVARQRTPRSRRARASGVPPRQSPARLPGVRRGRRVPPPDLAFASATTCRAWTRRKRTFDSRLGRSSEGGEPLHRLMRCVAYCDEVMCDDALTRTARRVDRDHSFDRQPLECEQCGNCIEVCPVGALPRCPTASRRAPGT